jgi:hypothetical protein
MGLSKHAQEEVDRQIKDLFLAFYAGITWTETGGVTKFSVIYSGFIEWMNYRHAELADYIDIEDCAKWWEA